MSQRPDFCKVSLKKAFPKMRGAVVDDIIDQLEGLRKISRDTREFNDLARKFMQEYTDKAKKIVENKKKNAMVIDQEYRFLMENFGDNMVEGLESMLTGSRVGVQGSGLSVSSYQLAMSQEAFSSLNYGLNKNQLLTLAKSGDLDRDLFKIAYAKNKRMPVPKDVDPRALELADVYFKVSNIMQDKVELAGSARRRSEGYLGRRAYDGLKVDALGKENFINLMEETLDFDATFNLQADDPKFIKDFLGDLFDDIRSGAIDTSRLKSNGPEFAEVFSQGSLDARKSKSRELMFKSGDAEYKVHKELGKEVILQDIVEMIGRDSRYASAMQRLGPDFERNWNALNSLAMQNAKPEQSAKLREKQNYLNGLFDFTVKGPQVGQSTLAKNVMVAKALNRMAILGGVTPISAITDFASHVANVRNATGQNYFSAMYDSFGQYLSSVKLSSSERLELFKELGAYVDNGLGEYISRFSPDEIMLGTTSRMQDMFFRMTLQTQQSGHWMMSNERHFGKVLGGALKKDKLNPQADMYLRKFGIGEEERALLRNAVDSEGRVTYESMELLKDQMGPKEFEKLKLKVNSYLKINSQRISHPAPGERERYLLDLGLDKDSVGGVLWNLITDLKSFPISMWSTVNGMTRMSDPSKPNMSFKEALSSPAGAKTMALLISSMTIAGGMSVMLRDMAQNKKPKFDSKFVVRSMTAGGALGMYGDFLLADYGNRFRSLSGDILGPVISGPATTISSYISDIIHNQGSSIKPSKAIQDIYRTIPGNNIFYTKAILDYYILENLQEAVEPGFKAKKRRNQRRRGDEPLL
jgi:hypothetical protein